VDLHLTLAPLEASRFFDNEQASEVDEGVANNP
jgi:hypothetical protein